MFVLYCKTPLPPQLQSICTCELQAQESCSSHVTCNVYVTCDVQVWGCTTQWCGYFQWDLLPGLLVYYFLSWPAVSLRAEPYQTELRNRARASSILLEGLFSTKRCWARGPKDVRTKRSADHALLSMLGQPSQAAHIFTLQVVDVANMNVQARPSLMRQWMNLHNAYTIIYIYRERAKNQRGEEGRKEERRDRERERHMKCNNTCTKTYL